jgi:hypothetical protein
MQGISERTWGGAQNNPKQCYFIGLAHNDYTRIERGDYVGGIGTIADINYTDSSQNADSYVGWYARIIQSLKSIEPRAYIFLITTPTHFYSAYNQKVRELREDMLSHGFNRIYLIDLETYSRERGPWNIMGNHLSAAGYLYAAYEIMTYVDWIVRNNGNDFKYTALVGTDILDTAP